MSLQDLLRRNRHWSVREQLNALNAALRGHYAYYGIAGNFRSLQKVHRAVERYWHKMLCSRSWAGRLTWDMFHQIKQRQPILLDAVRALRRARQQLSGFLLRQGCHYGRPAWTKLYRRWLAGLRFEQAAHHIVLEDYIEAVEAAEARRDRLTAQIEEMLHWHRSWRRCRRCAAWPWSMRRR